MFYMRGFMGLVSLTLPSNYVYIDDYRVDSYTKGTDVVMYKSHRLRLM